MKLITAASFPSNYFLKSLAIRRDNSVPVTSMLHNELWYVPPVTGDIPVQPSLVHKFCEHTIGIVEVEEDIFYITTGNIHTTNECYLHRINLQQWKPGMPIKPTTACRFPKQAKGVNGMCVIAANILLTADSFAGLIWRIDILKDGNAPEPRIWLKHYTMDHSPDGPYLTVQASTGSNIVRPTSTSTTYRRCNSYFTAYELIPRRWSPTGEPEQVACGMMGDDFVIDEDEGVANITTHRRNIIKRVPLVFGLKSITVVGEPFTEQLVGPTNGGRQP
jgi:hypothetical protein